MNTIRYAVLNQILGLLYSEPGYYAVQCVQILKYSRGQQYVKILEMAWITRQPANTAARIIQVGIICVLSILVVYYVFTPDSIPQDNYEGNVAKDENNDNNRLPANYQQTQDVNIQRSTQDVAVNALRAFNLTHDVAVGKPDILGAKKQWVPERSVVPRANHLDILRSGLVTNVVHYLWCERKIFEFQHYLSVLSAVRIINPERVVFHYSHYPRYDTQFYHTWFEDMKKEFPYIQLIDLGPASNSCISENSQREYISNILYEQGGIYVHFNTIFLNFPIKYREISITDGLSNGMEGFMIINRGIRYDTNVSSKITCRPAAAYDKSEMTFEELSEKNSKFTCVIKKGPYYPRDAWNKTDIFSKSVNNLLYDSPSRPEPQPSTDELIPNIGHVVWIGGANIPYLFYLNCLSQLFILEVDILYIHCDVDPTGTYWNLIKQEKKVTVVRIIKPDLIFRNKIKVLNHMSDVYRVNILSRYGGIYSDSDAIWVKPIPHHLRAYDAVASYDWPQMYNIYPDYIQIGVLLGKPGARIWNHMMHSFKHFKDDMYGYNGLLRTYKVFERHPDLLYVYDKLQVMCWDLRCHPTWYPDFRNKDTDHRQHTDFNWRDAHTFHWTVPTPDELENEEALRQSNSIFAEIGRHVLKAAGKL